MKRIFVLFFFIFLVFSGFSSLNAQEYNLPLEEYDKLKKYSEDLKQLKKSNDDLSRELKLIVDSITLFKNEKDWLRSLEQTVADSLLKVIIKTTGEKNLEIVQLKDNVNDENIRKAEKQLKERQAEIAKADSSIKKLKDEIHKIEEGSGSSQKLLIGQLKRRLREFKELTTLVYSNMSKEEVLSARTACEDFAKEDSDVSLTYDLLKSTLEQKSIYDDATEVLSKRYDASVINRNVENLDGLIKVNSPTPLNPAQIKELKKLRSYLADYGYEVQVFQDVVKLINEDAKVLSARKKSNLAEAYTRIKQIMEDQTGNTRDFAHYPYLDKLWKEYTQDIETSVTTNAEKEIQDIAVE